MKTVNYVALFFSLVLISIGLQNCGPCDPCDECDECDECPKSPKEELTGYLLTNSTLWSLKSIVLPLYSASEEDQWTGFNLEVSESTMTTSGHASKSTKVWPTGGWEMNENGTEITRSDGVIMTIITLTSTRFKVTFRVPEGTVIDGRTMALDGDYVFDLQK